MAVISLTVNGAPVTLDAAPNARLLDVLRNQLGLTGTKESCGQGECGACTVLLDGLAVHACLVLAPQADGCAVTTIEGLQQNGELDRIQQCFLDVGAVQCGYCTPGMVMATKALLLQNPHPTLADVQEALAGNICRCTGYKKIIEGAMLAAQGGGAHA